MKVTLRVEVEVDEAELLSLGRKRRGLGKQAPSAIGEVENAIADALKHNYLFSDATITWLETSAQQPGEGYRCRAAECTRQAMKDTVWCPKHYQSATRLDC